VWDGRGDEGRKTLEISGGREEDDGREAMKNEINEQVESVVDRRSDMTVPLRSERGSKAYHLSPNYDRRSDQDRCGKARLHAQSLEEEEVHFRRLGDHASCIM